MARREKKPVHKVVMTEGKRNIIQQLLREYDIETAEDIQDALKDLLGGTIKEMMEAEMDDHLGYQKSERSDSDDYRNGYKSKRVNSSYGSMDIDVPQDRKSTFEPQIVKKRQKDISDIDQKIISMYAKGMTTRQISETIEDIYGFETSEGFISDVTDKILPQIEDWQNRPLDEVYPILYIDAIHYSVRDNGVIRKLAAYVILGINTEGKKEVLSITVGDNGNGERWDAGFLKDFSKVPSIRRILQPFIMTANKKSIGWRNICRHRKIWRLLQRKIQRCFWRIWPGRIRKLSGRHRKIVKEQKQKVKPEQNM